VLCLVGTALAGFLRSGTYHVFAGCFAAHERGKNMTRLAGKVAVITGASSGIGAACAHRFAAEGAEIAGIDLQEAGDVWKDAVGDAVKASFATADVRDEAQVVAAISAAQQTHGRIDILVNAAGVAGMGPVHLLAEEEWDRVLDINLKGTYLVSKAVLAGMMEQGSGSIIHLASVEAYEGLEMSAAYNASKGGVRILTKNMALDYGPKGIRVNCLCPGFIDTPMTAMLQSEALGDTGERIASAHVLGRFGKPEEVAAAALFLASEDASFVTGHALVVDGGYLAGHRFGFGDMMG